MSGRHTFFFSFDGTDIITIKLWAFQMQTIFCPSSQNHSFHFAVYEMSTRWNHVKQWYKPGINLFPSNCSIKNDDILVETDITHLFLVWHNELFFFNKSSGNFDNREKFAIQLMAGTNEISRQQLLLRNFNKRP